MSISDRKEREKERRRANILAAAEHLFAKDGFMNTTLDQIAEEVEISKATIYLYFKNKEDLFFTLIREKFEALIQKISVQLATAQSLEELVNIGVHVMIDESCREHYLFRLTHAEQAKIKSQEHREVRQQIMKLRGAYVHELEQAVERFIPSDAPVSPRAVALTMTGATTAVIMEWMISNGSVSLDNLKTEISTIIQRGIVHA